MRNTSLELLKKFENIITYASPEDLEAGREFLEHWESEKSLSFWSNVCREQTSLKHILEINKALNSRQDLQSLLELIMDTAIKLMHAERGFLILSGKKNIQIARNFDQECIDQPKYKLSYSIAENVLEKGVPILTADAQKDPSFRDVSSVKNLQLRSVICVPLRNRGYTKGCLYLDNRFLHGAFSEQDLSILSAFADQATMAIETASLLEELDKRREEVETLVSKLKDKVENQEEELYVVKKRLAEKEDELAGHYKFGDIIGESQAMKDLILLASRAAESDVPVLVIGESGTGKELLARAIHFHSTRRNAPFIAENCSAISENLLESELFGYVKGAFTGANNDKQGLFQAANKGSLLLDELGDMPLSMQAKLLRVLETGEVRPVGSQKSINVNVRIISATHRNLQDMVKEGKFREDLYYRIRVVTLTIPPLRERPTDIPHLVQYFLKHTSEAIVKKINKIDPDALKALMRFSWPGNIRQLEHEIKKIVVLKRAGDTVTLNDLSEEISGANTSNEIPSELTLREAVRKFEQMYIKRTIRSAKGNKAAAARRLGLSRRALYNKLAEEGECHDDLKPFPES